MGVPESDGAHEIELLVDVGGDEDAGEDAGQTVEELVIVGVEVAQRGQRRFVAEEREVLADLDVHAPLGEDRQVGLEERGGHVEPKARVSGSG